MRYVEKRKKHLGNIQIRFLLITEDFDREGVDFEGTKQSGKEDPVHYQRL